MSITFKKTIEGSWTYNKSNNTYSTTVDYVFLSDAGESNVTVSQNSNLPLKNAPHPDSALYKMSDITCAVSGDKTRRKHVFTVTFTRGSLTIQVTGRNDNIDDDTKPWKLPMQGLTVGNEEQIVDFERGYSSATSTSKTDPVISTVGYPLYASTTQQITVLSFNYNLRRFRSDMARRYQDTVNRRPVYIPGYGTVAAYTGWLRVFSSSLHREYNTSGRLRWKYYNIRAEIAISDVDNDIDAGLYPWARQFANKALHFKDSDGTHRIWTAQNKTTDAISYGTKKDMLVINANADAVSESMFLSSAGAIIEPPVTSSTIHFLTFHDKLSTDWRSLSFPKE